MSAAEKVKFPLVFYPDPKTLRERETVAKNVMIEWPKAESGHEVLERVGAAPPYKLEGLGKRCKLPQ